jgi:hypothetical protein
METKQLTRQITADQLNDNIAQVQNRKRPDGRKSVSRNQANYVYRSRGAKLAACRFYYD